MTILMILITLLIMQQIIQYNKRVMFSKISQSTKLYVNIEKT